MSGNLAEFLKVLTIVVSWSTLILVGRHAMLSLDKEEEEEELNPVREIGTSSEVSQSNNQKEYEEAI